MALTHCRHFSGYKPCPKNLNCDESCAHKDKFTETILVVHLEALGAVLRSTALLPAIKRKFPKSHITFVTKSPANQLLKGNSFIDRLLTTETHDLLSLNALQFDVGFTVDKSLAAIGIMNSVKVEKIYGFVSGRAGAILPATPAAQELWEVGLSDELKFKINKKPETQLVCEALELSYFRDDYAVYLTQDEEAKVAERKKNWGGGYIIGINTGCSGVIPYKKLSVSGHRQMIKKLKTRYPSAKVVLLGGREDTAQNVDIAEGLDVILSPTENGLRDGLISVAACDSIITGDSLGMHMAIALKKWTVAWFGPTCAHEIDLFDRGVKILSQASCGPCWKRHCQKPVMCFDQVDFDRIVDSIPGVPNPSRQQAELLDILSSNDKEIM